MEPLCNCNMHESGTIPLLLTRTSVALTETNAPALPSTFKSEFVLSGDVSYTTRLIRSGYVYLYDNVKKKWIDYYVTPRGYYFLIPQGANFNEGSINNNDFNCLHTPDAQGISSFISVKAYKEGSFHIVWSPISWSENTRNKFNDKSFRDENMQLFDTGAWWNHVVPPSDVISDIENSVNFSSLESVIAEYNNNTYSKKSLFERRSAAPWAEKSKDFANMVKRAADKILYKGGAIVNISDPTGLAADIAALMKGSSDDKIYNNDKDDFNRKLFLNTTIDTIVEGVKESYSLLKDQRDQIMDPMSYSLSGFVEGSREARQTEFINFEKSIETRYLSHIKQDERQAFITEYKEESEKLLTTILTPLSELHVNLMNSRELLAQFDNHFDPNESDKEQGLEYTGLFITCIKDTQEQALCAKQYQDWFISPTKLLDNAISFNQQKLKQELNKVFPNGQAAIPDTGNLIDLIDKGLSEGHITLVGLLMSELSRPITHLLAKGLSDNTNSVVSKLARLLGKRFVTLQVEGYFRTLVSDAVAFIKKNTDIGNVNGKNLGKVLDKKLEHLFLVENDSNKKMKVNYVVVIDTKDFTKISDVKSKVLTTSERNKLLAGIVQNKMMSGVSLGVKALGLYAQIVSLNELYKKLDEGDTYKRRFIATATSLGFISFEYSFSKFVLPKIVSQILKKRLLFAVTGVGLIIGAGIAVCDLWDGVKHLGVYNELSFIDFMSSAINLSFVIALFSRGVGGWFVGIWLVGFMIFVEYSRALWEITDIEKWLMCTKWGIVSDKLTGSEKSYLVPFLSLKQEQDALQLIINKD